MVIYIYIYFSCDCNNLTKGVASGIHGKKPNAVQISETERDCLIHASTGVQEVTIGCVQPSNNNQASSR